MKELYKKIGMAAIAAAITMGTAAPVRANGQSPEFTAFGDNPCEANTTLAAYVRYKTSTRQFLLLNDIDPESICVPNSQVKALRDTTVRNYLWKRNSDTPSDTPESLDKMCAPGQTAMVDVTKTIKQMVINSDTMEKAAEDRDLFTELGFLLFVADENPVGAMGVKMREVRLTLSQNTNIIKTLCALPPIKRHR